MFPTVAGVPTYAVFQIASVVVCAGMLIWYLAPRDGWLGHAAALTALYCACNFVAAKFFFDLRHDPASIRWIDYIRLEHYFAGGFWGWPAAFLPALLAYAWLLPRDRARCLRAMSLTLPVVIIWQKLGCLFIGCCVGRPTDLPWGITFPEGSQCETPGVPVHPVPLYDMAFAAAIYAVLCWLDRRDATRPFLFPAFVGLYGLNRFATEFFRPEFTNALSLRQVLALAASLGVLALIPLAGGVWKRWLAGERSADVVPA